MSRSRRTWEASTRRRSTPWPSSVPSASSHSARRTRPPTAASSTCKSSATGSGDSMHVRRLTCLVVALLACGFGPVLSADPPADIVSQPLSPEDSLKQLVVRPGLRVELVAAEPLVVDPVAIAWGPDGKLWVVEMNDYPLGE